MSSIFNHIVHHHHRKKSQEQLHEDDQDPTKDHKEEPKENEHHSRLHFHREKKPHKRRTKEKYSVHIIEATIFKSTDSNGLSDPFVRISKNDPINGTKTLSVTPIIYKSLHPKWNFTEEFEIKSGTKILIELFDQDRMGSDFVGSTEVVLDGTDLDFTPPHAPLVLKEKKKFHHEPQVVAHLIVKFTFLEQVVNLTKSSSPPYSPSFTNNPIH